LILFIIRQSAHMLTMSHFRFMRMSPDRFSHLAGLLTPYLQKQSITREPLSVKERLAITLRYLATGIVFNGCSLGGW